MTVQDALPAATAATLVAEFLRAPPPGTPPALLAVLAERFGQATPFAVPSAATEDALAPSTADLCPTDANALPTWLYREAVEQAPVAISITDPEANILYANTAFERLTGYARAAVLGHNESLLSSNATPKIVYRTLWETIQARRVWTGRLVNRTRAGDDYLAELTVAPVLDADGTIRYFLGMHRDVTKEHTLEVESRQQHARLETVLDAAPAVVALLDRDAGVMLANREYEKLREDLRGREPARALLAALREQTGADPLARALAGDGFKGVEIVVDMPGGGPRWFACSGAAVSEADASARGYFATAAPAHCLLLAHEVTARRREIERAHLEHLRARLAEQQLNEGLQEALTAACYRLQGPLNLIRAATALGGGDPATFAATLAQVGAASEEALATLRAALPTARPAATVPVNINELLRQVLELETDRLLAAGVLIDWQPALVLPQLSGHRDRLRSLFKYLLDNALLAFAESRSAERVLRLSTRARDDDTVEVTVEDNGPGVPPSERLKVFEPFYIGWRQRRGRAGMGLTLAQEIVNQHDGSIDIDPDTTVGCRVRVLLGHATRED